MANKGPHSNGSQFYITLQPTSWMDRTYVAFGFDSLNCLLHFQFCIMSAFSYSVLFYIYFFFLILANSLKVLMSSRDQRRFRLSMRDLTLNVKSQIVECLRLKAHKYTHTHVMYEYPVHLQILFSTKLRGCSYLFALSVELNNKGQYLFSLCFSVFLFHFTSCVI